MCRDNDYATVYITEFCSYCEQLAAIGSPVLKTNKLHWYFRGLGPMFSTFSLSYMYFTPPPALRDVISEVESYSLLHKSLEDPFPASMTFTAREEGRVGVTHHRTISMEVANMVIQEALILLRY